MPTSVKRSTEREERRVPQLHWLSACTGVVINLSTTFPGWCDGVVRDRLKEAESGGVHGELGGGQDAGAVPQSWVHYSPACPAQACRGPVVETLDSRSSGCGFESRVSVVSGMQLGVLSLGSECSSAG